ncbi:hypothetical protein [Wenzhouxiangella sp. EGI_FJ10305]|uniref:hypothetical protein n=1 Tax=Wenzhouxiangella sp. EGI_FJ10305 TaxID=3243768 RepID=UPI0035DDAA47
MFDLQRNLLTSLLTAGIGLLVLAGGVMALLMGRPDLSAIAPQGNTEAPDAEVDVPETGLQEFSAYSAIVERPVFFSDRQLPVVDAPGETEEEMMVEEEPEAEEIEDLEAEIAGIVITPDMKLAMVSDKRAEKTFVLREGMSLEGEQAAWKLDVIQPRNVSFVSVDGRQTELELKVNTKGVASSNDGSRQREQASEGQPEGGQAAQEGAQREASEEARARAEEIRRRVAERRAQLRAEAERRAQQQQQQDNDG